MGKYDFYKDDDGMYYHNAYIEPNEIRNLFQEYGIFATIVVEDNRIKVEFDTVDDEHMVIMMFGAD